MSSTCKHCSAPVPKEGDLCFTCYDALPAVFECADCGEKCYKKDGDFGAWEMTEEGEKAICTDCYEIECEESNLYDQYMEDALFLDHMDEEM